MHSRAPLILLVGMHRSGTSLLGAVLKHLGVAVPGDLIPGDAHNPEGYYERRDITALQESLLIDLDRFWAGPQGSQLLPKNWRAHPSTLAFENSLRDLLLKECQRQCGPWAIKDPRSSLLLPIWRDLCQELEIPLQLVLAVRNPEAVVCSLMARDARLAGMTWWRAQQLWWRFNSSVLGSMPNSEENHLFVVHYEQWFSNPANQARELAFALRLKVPDQKSITSLEGSIKYEHRHQQFLPEIAPPLDFRIRRLYQYLLDERTPILPYKIRLQPFKPRRNFKQQLVHNFDWIWLLGSPLVQPVGLINYRKTFLQGKSSRQLISPVWITNQQPSLLFHHRDPVAWYARFGWKQGVSPHPLLLPERVWAQLGIRREVVSLYIREGLIDDIDVHPLFDSVYYTRQCRDDLKTFGLTPLEHYLSIGWEQGISPHRLVDPSWMKAFHGLPDEPITALILAGIDTSDPGLTHPRGNLYGAALNDARCKARLPRALVDLLQAWHAKEIFLAENWLDLDQFFKPLPNFDYFGLNPSIIFSMGISLSRTKELFDISSLTFEFKNTLSWKAQLLLNSLPQVNSCSGKVVESIVVLENESDFDQFSSRSITKKNIKKEYVINFLWPMIQDLSTWIQELRVVFSVLDPDPQRAAFLKLFGVNVFCCPFIPLKINQNENNELLREAQLQLGLPDPRWFDSPLYLAVIGSSGVENESRWGKVSCNIESQGLLLFPRLPQLKINDINQLKCLQAWIDQLSISCESLLWLEPVADGACIPQSNGKYLGKEEEQQLLHFWENKST